MSGKELSRAIGAMHKRWIVRVSNGTTERPDKLVKCSTRVRAEKMQEKRELEGFKARVECELVA